MTIDVQITKKNGESFTFEQYDIIVEDFTISSIPLEPAYARAEGSDRQIDYGSNYQPRTITVPFTMKAHDLHDYPLLRDFLFEKVNDKESFYIQEMRRAKMLAYAFVDTNEDPRMQEGTENKLVGGKQYLVRLQNVFELEQMLEYGKGELVFETTELPFAESIGTTQDIQRNGISANDELWGFGMGLQSVDETLEYTHTIRSGEEFLIYNAGIPIHPFEQELTIKITDVNGSNKFFELRNETNGTTFRVNEGVKSDQTILIDGANITSNGLTYFRKTNRQYIQLDAGPNHFSIDGASRATIEFDFRFYYL